MRLDINCGYFNVCHRRIFDGNCDGCTVIECDGNKKLFTKLDDIMNDIKSDMKNVGGDLDKPKHERLKIVPMILETIDKKNDEYSVDPISVLSIDDLITQMYIKIIRSRYAKSPEKRLDEIIDIIVYGILTGEKQVELVDKLKKEYISCQ